MTFNILQLGRTTSGANGLAPVMSTYQTTDSLSEVLGVNYFAQLGRRVQDNDLIYIVHNEGRGLFYFQIDEDFNIQVKPFDNLNWRAPVEDIINFTIEEPPSPQETARYINLVTGISNVTSTPVTKDYIYEWHDGRWQERIPSAGWIIYDKLTKVYVIYDGLNWNSWTPIAVAYVDTFFVAKHGFDTNPGTSPEQSFVTLAAAVAAASPTVTTPVLIEVLDSGIYTISNLTIPSYLTVDARNATISGNWLMIDAFGTVICRERTEGSTFNGTGTGRAYFECDLLSPGAYIGISNTVTGTAQLDARIKLGSTTGPALINPVKPSHTSNVQVDDLALDASGSVGIDLTSGILNAKVGRIIKVPATSGTQGISISSGGILNLDLVGDNTADTPITNLGSLFIDGPKLGRLLNQKRLRSTSYQIGTTIMPVNVASRINTEGDQYMTLTYTPEFVGTTLFIETMMHLSHSNTGTWMTVGIWKDSDTYPLGVGTNVANTPQGGYQVTALASFITTSLSTITFKVRAGGHIVGTTYVNGNSTGLLHGGDLSTELAIWELRLV